MDDQPLPPHGNDVFNSRWNCDCRKCGPLREAVRRLVDSFSHVPATWIEELAEHRGEFLPLPMWGTLFVPKEPSDVRNIEALLRDIQVDDEDDEMFASAGWREIADTGIYAVRFDDELLLGIDGCGYDFYDAHWSPLYDALGYRWHESSSPPAGDAGE